MALEMTSRERVRAALSHQEPDRVPIDFGQGTADGIAVVAYRGLLDHLGYQGRAVTVKEKRGQVAKPDEDILRRFHVDFRVLELQAPERWKDVPLGENSYRDEWGCIRTMPEDGYYYDLTHYPFAEDGTLSALNNHSWPDPDDPGRYRGLREQARRMREETDFAIVMNLNCGFYAQAAQMRGWEHFFMDLAANVEFAEALMDKILEIRLAVGERALEEVGEYVDAVFAASDDLGMIDRTMMSPAMYRTLLKPRHKKVFDGLKKHTSAPMVLHCDGAIYPLLQDLVDVGMDALNPVQVSASGMGDTAKLKRDFGDEIVFWGGIDTFQAMPFGTPEDVREEVKRRIADLAAGGGYVICPVHNLQPEVPPENVVALYDAAWEFGRYR